MCYLNSTKMEAKTYHRFVICDSFCLIFGKDFDCSANFTESETTVQINISMSMYKWGHFRHITQRTCEINFELSEFLPKM